MRVTHVYKDVYPPIAGGIEMHINDVRTAMTDITSDVIVCSRSRATSTTAVGTGTETRVGEFGRLLSTPIAPRFPLAVRRARADLLHVHMPNPLAELSAIALPRSRPFVVSYHADIVRQAWLMPAYRFLIDACLRRARTVVVGTRGIVRNSEPLRRFEDKVRYVPYAVDTDRFDRSRVPGEVVAELRERYGSPLVVAVGRLVYYKGFDHLIAAARDLDASVVIAGAGPLEADLRRDAAGTGNVHVLGSVADTELIALLAAADCFVLPSTSRAESFGIATLEAQSMGVPAIVTDVGTGTTEAIAPGESGVVVAPGQPAAIASAVRSVLGDPGMHAEMKSAARRHAVEHHSLTTQARRLREVYDDALGGIGRAG